MTKEPCDGCGRPVRIGGGIADLWNFDRGSTGGLTLELADDSEHFLCFDCLDTLPGDREVTAADVAALPGSREAP